MICLIYHYHESYTICSLSDTFTRVSHIISRNNLNCSLDCFYHENNLGYIYENIWIIIIIWYRDSLCKTCGEGWWKCKSYFNLGDYNPGFLTYTALVKVAATLIICDRPTVDRGIQKICHYLQAIQYARFQIPLHLNLNLNHIQYFLIKSRLRTLPTAGMWYINNQHSTLFYISVNYRL